ncbi:MAG: radical SAM protein [Elusimicrobia bacterium]|nr:radical SAM protein [Candidatus Liberimonas magnetica]
MEIREVGVSRILNPTSIDLGDYVINPYKGCQFSCIYCYAQFNKSTLKDKRKWGSFVDVRLNAPLLLEKEILIKKPKQVLIGSITECFQPVETKYKITNKVLEILNKHGVYYSILTRSPLIRESLHLLKEGYCKAIYFTINNFGQDLKNKIELKSPPFKDRLAAIEELHYNKIPVIPSFSPILPFVTDINDIFAGFEKYDTMNFEGLNFNLGNISKVIDAITGSYPYLKQKYNAMVTDNKIYNGTWQSIKNSIEKYAKENNKVYNVYIHGRKDYFKNTYSNSNN